MKYFSNGLIPAEIERLALLAEECGEVVQTVSKVLRHGYDSRGTNGLLPKTNRRALAEEIGHVRFAISLMTDNDDVHEGEIAESIQAKRISVRPYLHHQGK